MRYFLDTEYNGSGGELISLALVPQDGSEEFYATLAMRDVPVAWVERHVIPYLDTVPQALKSPRLSRLDTAEMLSQWLAHDDMIEIVADWPEDIAQFSMLLLTGPGDMVRMPSVTFRFLSLRGFSTAANSAVPHNALHDARALRDHHAHLD